MGEHRNKQIFDLLRELFTVEQLRRLLTNRFSWGAAVINEVPGDLVSPAHILQSIIDELGRGGYLDQDLFLALLDERPRRAAEITGVAVAFDVRLGSAAPTPIQNGRAGGVGLGRYDAQRYVPWPREEARARDVLADGVPLVVWGPARVGKTWFIQHLLEEQRAHSGEAAVVYVDLDALESTALQSYGAFLEALLRLIFRRQPGAPNPHGVEDSMDFEDRLLAWLERLDRVVLAIDRADRIRGQPFNDDFWAFLRSRSKGLDVPWNRMHLLLGISAAPEELTRDRNNSPFENMGERVALRRFDLDQLGRLVEQYGLTLSAAELQVIHQQCEGNPYRLRRALYEHSRGGR